METLETKSLQISKGETVVKRFFRMSLNTISFSVILLALVLILSPAALASGGTLVTNDSVNFRAGASTDAEVYRTLGPGTSVEVLEHDPAGWSKVKHNGTVGYMRSEYLTIPSGTESVTFLTTDGVNFRSGPSLDETVITSFVTGTRVEVLEHNPAGWSKVRANSTVGYIKSEFLALPLQNAPQNTSSPSQPQDTLRTIDGVNFRSGPSVESGVIRTLEANTSVAILERDSSGWSKVMYGDTVGYIRSDLLSVSGRSVELLDWSVVRTMIQRNTTIPVIDVRTGRTYNIKCFSIYDHADVETVTSEDTEIFFDIRNGVRSWAARPVWVLIGDRLIAASLHGMPHDVDFIPNNGVNGHFCLHFLGSTTTSTSISYKTDLQNAVQEAWNAR